MEYGGFKIKITGNFKKGKIYIAKYEVKFKNGSYYTHSFHDNSSSET